MIKSTNERNQSIDCMKAILVIGMILAHTFQILHLLDIDGSKYITATPIFRNFSIFIDVTTFSSFLFCFGYVCQLAYLQKDKIPYFNVLKNFKVVLIVYYISAFGIILLTNDKPLTINDIVDVLVFNRIVAYSEFLLAFACIYLLIIPFGKFINYILEKKILLLIVSLGLFVLSRFIPYDFIPPQLGIFIGTSHCNSFPLILYFPYFLLGAYISKYGIIRDSKIFVLCTILSLIGISFIIRFHFVPLRFPPSFYWLVMPALYVYLLYLLSCKLGNLKRIGFLTSIGRNTLFYLLASNIILFTFRKSTIISYQWYSLLLIAFLIFLICRQIITIVKKN